MITYSLEDSGIFYVRFSDSVSAEDIKKYLSDFAKINDLPLDFLSLYDLRDANLTIVAEDVASISNLANKIVSSFRTVRTAFLVNKPDITAYSILFKNSASKGIAREVFSTREAAINWLTNMRV